MTMLDLVIVIHVSFFIVLRKRKACSIDRFILNNRIIVIGYGNVTKCFIS